MRHRPRARAGRALPGEVLPGGHGVHHLRHRARLPLSLGRHLPAPRALRPGRDGGVPGHGDRGLRLCPVGGSPRLGSGPEADRVRRPAHPPGEDLAARTIRPRPDERSGLMGLEGINQSFLTTRLEDLVKWARRNSVWPATFGLACCAIEMMATGAAHYDLSRFGMEVFRASPRQAY